MPDRCTRQVRTDAWITPAGAHCTLSATPRSQRDWTRLLAAAAAGPADRSVVAISVESGVAVRGVVRLVARDHPRAAAARAALLKDPIVGALPGKQTTGVARSLPFGGPPKELAEALCRYSR